MAGSYPAEVDGVVERTACFDATGSGQGTYSCHLHAVVAIVRCGGFFLWRLADAPSCSAAYCTTTSGVGDGGGSG